MKKRILGTFSIICIGITACTSGSNTGTTTTAISQAKTSSIKPTEETTIAESTTVVEPTTIIETSEPTTIIETSESTTSIETVNNNVSHIYNDAVIKNVMNGLRTEKLGEYSYIYAMSDQITQEVLEDWYFNYVTKNKHNFDFIIFTDKNSTEGIFSNSGFVYSNISISKDEHGDYSAGDMSNAKMYYKTDDNKLQLFEE